MGSSRFFGRFFRPGATTSPSSSSSFSSSRSSRFLLSPVPGPLFFFEDTVFHSGLVFFGSSVDQSSCGKNSRTIHCENLDPGPHAELSLTIWYAAQIGQRSLRLFVTVDVCWHTFERVHACSPVDFPILIHKTAWFEYCVERPISHEVAEPSIFVD